MPFTPFHFGPHATVGLPFGKRIDLPVFLLANVAVDLEPLLVMTYHPPNYPVHGYCHTFLIGAAVGLVLCALMYPFRGVLQVAMRTVRLPYEPKLGTMAISAVAGVWFHVLFDSILYFDIRPFWPSEANPLLGLLTSAQVHTICRVSMVVALVLWLIFARNHLRKARPNIPDARE